jgi:hypothetical protein
MAVAGKFVVACPHCQAKLNCSRQHLGKNVACVKCRQPLQIPTAADFDAAQPPPENVLQPRDSTFSAVATSEFVARPRASRKAANRAGYLAKVAYLCVVIIAGLVGYIIGTSQNQGNSFQVNRPFSDDRPISVVEADFGDWKGFTVMNSKPAPVTILKVRYNGEFDAELAEPNGLGVNKANRLPMTLAIAEQAIFHCRSSIPNLKSYDKPVLFTDVVTDRGTFRSDSRGMPQKPD